MHNHVQSQRDVRVLNQDERRGSRTRFQEIDLKVFHWGDFRKNSETHGEEVEKVLGRPLKGDEFAMVISLSRRTIRLVFPLMEKPHLTNLGKNSAVVLKIRPSMDYRITDGGEFSLHDIEKYTNDMGFSIKNRKKVAAALAQRGEN